MRVQAIEIRLLGLGDEPVPPVLHQPSCLGTGKARITWSAIAPPENASEGDGYETVTATMPAEHDNSIAAAADVAGAILSRQRAAEEEQYRKGEAEAESAGERQLPGSAGGRGREEQEEAAAAPSGSDGRRAEKVDGDDESRAATFPIHKYVLQRSRLDSHEAAAVAVSRGQGSGAAEGSARVAGGDVGSWGGVSGIGGGRDGRGRGGADGGWVTVHEAPVGFASEFVFLDTGLSPGVTYVYR